MIYGIKKRRTDGSLERNHLAAGGYLLFTCRELHAVTLHTFVGAHRWARESFGSIERPPVHT